LGHPRRVLSNPTANLCATVAQQRSDNHHKESLHLYHYLTKHSD
jgi:hypothetical protein